MSLGPLFTDVYPCTIELIWDYASFIYNYQTEINVNCVEELKEGILNLDQELLDDSLEAIQNFLNREDLNSIDKIVYIFDINVQEGYQRQGIGTKAVRELSDLAKNHGYEYIMCEHASKAGKNFFENLGYEHFSGGVMAKKL